MATLEVTTMDQGKAGTVELSAAVFEAPKRPYLLHAEVRRQLSKRRRGTHSTKNRSAVSGGGAKPWKQKGTGRARQGSNRSPQWEGGGVVFGPVPRSYEHQLPKKVRQAALRTALSEKQRGDALSVVDQIDLDRFSTKQIAALLAGLGVSDKKVLIVTGAADGKNRMLRAQFTAC